MQQGRPFEVRAGSPQEFWASMTEAVELIASDLMEDNDDDGNNGPQFDHWFIAMMDNMITSLYLSDKVRDGGNYVLARVFTGAVMLARHNQSWLSFRKDFIEGMRTTLDKLREDYDTPGAREARKMAEEAMEAGERPDQILDKLRKKGL